MLQSREPFRRADRSEHRPLLALARSIEVPVGFAKMVCFKRAIKDIKQNGCPKMTCLFNRRPGSFILVNADIHHFSEFSKDSDIEHSFLQCLGSIMDIQLISGHAIKWLYKYFSTWNNSIHAQTLFRHICLIKYTNRCKTQLFCYIFPFNLCFCQTVLNLSHQTTI